MTLVVGSTSVATICNCFVVVDVCLFLLYRDYSTSIAPFVGANSVWVSGLVASVQTLV